MSRVLIDTDSLSEILKQKDAAVLARAMAYVGVHGQFTFSALTRYEALRGLNEKGNANALAQFETFCLRSRILPIDNPVLARAADLWVASRRIGRPRSDADLIIAATALVEGIPLATGNTKHFDWITGLTLQDWRQVP